MLPENLREFMGLPVVLLPLVPSFKRHTKEDELCWYSKQKGAKRFFFFKLKALPGAQAGSVVLVSLL